MEKAKDFVKENLRGIIEEKNEDFTLSEEDNDDLKVRINTMLHMYLPPETTIAQTEAVATLINHIVRYPEEFIS